MQLNTGSPSPLPSPYRMGRGNAAAAARSLARMFDTRPETPTDRSRRRGEPKRSRWGTRPPFHEPMHGSADFQPAVSPTSSRQTVRTTQRQRVGNPRYGRLEICATGPLRLSQARFMAPMRECKFVEAFHEPSGSEYNCGLREVRNYSLAVHGRNARPKLEVQPFHEPMVEYRVAEENATGVALFSARRFKVARRVQDLEVETFHEPRWITIAELDNSAILSSRFMAATRERLLVRAFHEPPSAKRREADIPVCHFPAQGGRQECPPHGFIASTRAHKLVGPTHEAAVGGQVARLSKVEIRGLSTARLDFGKSSYVHGPNAPTPGWWGSPHVGGYETCEVCGLVSDHQQLREHFSLSPRQWGEGRGEGLRRLHGHC